MPDMKTLYDEDFVAWSRQQAEALRASAHGRTNQQLDWENLAEEIEGLGISQRSALASYIMRIIQYLAKLEFSPAIDPGEKQFASPEFRPKDGLKTIPA